MANRYISTELWCDKKWRKDMKDISLRYIWVYLLTCPNSKGCGIFYLPLDEMALHTRLGETECFEGIKELEEIGVCLYDRNTEEIAIFNFPKYNIKNMGKPIEDMLKREYAQVKSEMLINAMMFSLTEDVENSVGKQKDLLGKVLSLLKGERGLGIGDINYLSTKHYNCVNTYTYTDTDTDTDSVTDSDTESE